MKTALQKLSRLLEGFKANEFPLETSDGKVEKVKEEIYEENWINKYSKTLDSVYIFKTLYLIDGVKIKTEKFDEPKN